MVSASGCARMCGDGLASTGEAGRAAKNCATRRIPISQRAMGRTVAEWNVEYIDGCFPFGCQRINYAGTAPPAFYHGDLRPGRDDYNKWATIRFRFDHVDATNDRLQS